MATLIYCRAYFQLYSSEEYISGVALLSSYQIATDVRFLWGLLVFSFAQRNAENNLPQSKNQMPRICTGLFGLILLEDTVCADCSVSTG